ncbi:hypothetical protein [Niallia sp. MER 6]|uniref:hypothetical protein n=1 Tax=Niallia sp. MER 6 TaxID=2939567 RepID=UPI002041C3E1|nr:hypothetical protein [Niallia sp. MER 6]MCM3034051.1 hypothetical protein [Niallia sp. MER 6]
MNKSFSGLSLLNEKMSNSYKGLFQSFFSSKKYINVKLPYYDYLRGQVFIQDLRDNYPEDMSYSFDIGDLIHMLYMDFLQQIKRGVKNEDVAVYLKQSMEKYFPTKLVEQRVFKQVSHYSFQYEHMEEFEEDEEDEEKFAYLDIRTAEKIILRGEILLYDLSPFLNGTSVTLEQLIAIIYLDFIKNVQAHGNSIAVQQTILKKISIK